MPELPASIKDVWLLSKRTQELSVYDIADVGVPVNGTAGTGARMLGKGSTYTNVLTGIKYVNTGTTDSPIWTTQSAASALPSSALSGYGIFQVVKLTYDFSLDGGGIGTRIPVNSVLIPAGAVITSGYFVPRANLVSGGAATVAIGLIGVGSNALAGPNPYSDFNNIQNNNAVVWWTSNVVKITEDTAVSITIAGAALTAGKLEIYPWYFLAGY